MYYMRVLVSFIILHNTFVLTYYYIIIYLASFVFFLQNINYYNTSYAEQLPYLTSIGVYRHKLALIDNLF